mgnify:CR=1 FL=1
MKLSRSVVTDAAESYRESEPLAAVEDQHLDMLPGMFETGEFGRRDAQWVVRWYFRRLLGAYPDADRRRHEEQFWANDFETVRDVLVDLRSLDVDEALAETVSWLIARDRPTREGDDWVYRTRVPPGRHGVGIVANDDRADERHVVHEVVRFTRRLRSRVVQKVGCLSE